MSRVSGNATERESLLVVFINDDVKVDVGLARNAESDGRSQPSGWP